MIDVNALSGGGGGREPVSTQISQGAGTPIGNMTTGGGLAAAFDGNTSQAQSAGARSSNGGASFSGYNNTVGKDWGVDTFKTVDRFKFWGPNDNNVLGTQGTIDFKLQGSNDNSNWTDLYTATGVSSPSGSTVIDVTSGISVSQAYRYHRWNGNGNGSNGLGIAELQFWERA
jgi:hypothetical protein